MTKSTIEKLEKKMKKPKSKLEKEKAWILRAMSYSGAHWMWTNETIRRHINNLIRLAREEGKHSEKNGGFAKGGTE